MTADFTYLLLLLAAIPVVAANAVFFYWLGHRHGRQSVAHHFAETEPESEIETRNPLPEIPSYRINELVTLLELGILTPEEFEQEKGKLYAGGPA